MARQKLHPADRVTLRVVLGGVGLPAAMLLGWVAGKIAGSLW